MAYNGIFITREEFEKAVKALKVYPESYFIETRPALVSKLFGEELGKQIEALAKLEEISGEGDDREPPSGPDKKEIARDEVISRIRTELASALKENK